MFEKDQLHLKLGPKAKYWRWTTISTLDSLVELLLHRPVDVNVRREVFKDARDLCFTNCVVFVAERGSSAIRKNVNEDYLGDTDLRTLLTTQVENLHAVPHFKNETFTGLQYAKDFGTILKESSKRTTKWGAKYFTLEKSYYPVPKSSVELRDVDLMKPPPADNVDPNIEAAMKELVDRYRPVKDGKKRINKRQSGSLAASCIFQHAIVY